MATQSFKVSSERILWTWALLALVLFLFLSLSLASFPLFDYFGPKKRKPWNDTGLTCWLCILKPGHKYVPQSIFHRPHSQFVQQSLRKRDAKKALKITGNQYVCFNLFTEMIRHQAPPRLLYYSRCMFLVRSSCLAVHSLCPLIPHHTTCNIRLRTPHRETSSVWQYNIAGTFR